MALKRPIGGRPSDPVGADLYDAITGLPSEVAPETAPKLRSVTMPTIAEMRKFRGDTAGNLGPRACILAGSKTPLDGGQAVYVWDQTSVAKDDGVNVLQVSGVATGRWRLAMKLASRPALLRVTVLTSGSGNLASFPGTVMARARIYGAGGGSGGVTASVGNPFGNVAGGGSSGGRAEWWTGVIPTNWAYSIGTGGTAGANTGTAGGTGGDTTFGNGTTTVTAKGGNGGLGDSSGGSGPKLRQGGDSPAISTNGTLNGSGMSGAPGFYLSGSSAISGAGGGNDIAAGAPGRTTSGVGIAGQQPGAGASGALELWSMAAYAGAVGGAGMVVLEEFG